MRRKRAIVWFLSLLVIATVVTALQVQATQIGEDVMQNGGFEHAVDGKPLPWIAMGGWDNLEITQTAAAARSGATGIRIQTMEATKPWIAQDVLIEEGAVYDVSAWIKAAAVTGSGVGMKFEYYKGNTRIAANRLSQYDTTKMIGAAALTGDWQQLQFQMTAPPEAGLVLVYLRLFGTGTVDLDDASFRLVKPKPMIDMTTDHLFYDSTLSAGHVTAAFHPAPSLPNGPFHAEMTIAHTSTSVVIATYTHPDASQPMAASFDPSLMVKEEPYEVTVRMLDASDAVVETVTQTIYRFDRPTMLREDGTLIVDGAPFFPIGAYHVRTTDYPYLAEAGINLVQGVVTNNANVLRNALDAAHQHGLKVMVPLYGGGENITALTNEFVTQFQSHPAVIAWMIMDEPFSNGKTLDEIAEVYRLIRSLDKTHPAYMVEALPPYYATTAKATDILVTDVYTIPHQPIDLVGTRTALAKQAAGNKPVWNVLQAMYNPPNWPILPTIEQVRNAAYQSLLNGLQGLAYYAVNENTFQLRQSELWPGLVSFREELALFGRLVTDGTMVDRGEVNGGRWAVWEDGDVRYAAAVNPGTEPLAIDIPLGIFGYEAELLYGDMRSVYDEMGQTLSLELEPLQALLYRVTPYSNRVLAAQEHTVEALGLSTASAWTADLQVLLTKLAALEDEWTDAAPDAGAVAAAAMDALEQVESLRSWAANNSSGTTQQQMWDVLDAIRIALGSLAAPDVQRTILLQQDRLIGQETWNAFDVTLRWAAGADLQHIQMTATYPELFQLPDEPRAIPALANGQTATETFGFRIISPLPHDRYRLKANVEFTYTAAPTIPIVVETFLDVPYTNVVTARPEPQTIRVSKGGTYPLAMQVKRHVEEDVSLSFAGDAPAGFSLELPATVLTGLSDATVSGTVYVPLQTADGTYTVSVQVMAGGKLVQTISIPIVVDQNRLINPGFEQDNGTGTGPVGWLMRKGVRVQDDVYSGQYAVSLLPDAENAWNVINSDLIPIEPGGTYTLKGWVKHAATAGNVRIGLRQVKQDGAATVGYTWQTVPSGAQWTQYTLHVPTTATAHYVQVYVFVDQAVNAAASFDDFYVSEQAVE